MNQNDYGWLLFCTALITAGFVLGVALGAYLF